MFNLLRRSHLSGVERGVWCCKTFEPLLSVRNDHFLFANNKIRLTGSWISLLYLLQKGSIQRVFLYLILLHLHYNEFHYVPRRTAAEPVSSR